MAEWASPLEATKGDRLEGGLTVVKKLGGGSVAVVLLVEREGEQLALKVSRKPEYNARLSSEYDILKRLRWPTIVKRWDVSSECFSAAMTLHEMATGVLPRWGDGSLPNLIAEEVTIRPELFPADLRRPPPADRSRQAFITGRKSSAGISSVAECRRPGTDRI